MLQGAEVMGFERTFLTCTLSSLRSPDLFCLPEPVRRTQALNPQWVYLPLTPWPALLSAPLPALTCNP